MKINALIALALFLSSVTTSSFAWDNMDEINSNDRSISGYEENDNSIKGYESSFGNKYEYDLSRPSDRLRYEVDPGAQLRDSIDVNPIRDLERNLGQYGGGVIRE